MGYRNWKTTTKIITLLAVFCVLLFPENLWSATFEHFIYQVRKTNGDVAPGVNVNVYAPGTSTRQTVFSNITGTTIKSQPLITDSLGNVDFYIGDSVVDILFTGGTIPTYKLLNVTLTALATAGVLTVPNGGTGAATFTLNTVLLGNGTLPIKTSSVGLANQVFRVPAAGGQPDFGTVNLSSSAAVSGVLPTANGGTGSSSGSSLSVEEIDGSPDVPGVTNIKVSNGTLIDNGSGSVTVTTGGGGTTPPFIDTTSLVKGSIDDSKQIRFEVDGNTTSTIRVITPPNADVVLAATDFLNLWGDGIKQTFNPNGTNAGLNVGTHTADPSVGVNGDQYYDSVLNKFRCHENGAWGDCISAGTSPGGATTNVQYNDAGAFGGDADFVFDDTNKFVGIGTTAALTDEGLSVASAGTHNGVISSQRSDDDAPPGNSPGFRSYKSRGTVALPTAVQSGDWLLGLSVNAYDGSGFFGQGRIYNEATQNWTGSARGNRWVFSTTANGSTTITDRATLRDNGYFAVGIQGTHGIGLVGATSLANVSYGFASQLIGYRANTSEAASTSLGSGEDIHKYLIQGKCGSTEQCNGAEIRFSTSEAWSSANNTGTHIRFFTSHTDNPGVPVERVVIRNTGQIRIKEGTDAMMGTANLAAGTATVNNALVTANSRIFLTSQVDGGTPGFLRVSARTAGTSFTITSSDAADTSTVAWIIFDPTP
jgi:hypothetical protein